MKRATVILSTLTLLLTSVGQAHSALIFVASRGALGGNDFVNWANLGGPFTVVNNPFTITSNLGDTITVSAAVAGSFNRRDQGLGWAGNFAPGAPLIWTNQPGNNTNNPVSLFDFNAPGISAGGAQIQADTFGPFVARIEAFDSSNTSLGFFTVNGNSTGDGDNSAVFLGVRSTTTPITRIAFSLDSATSSIADFAINQFDFDNRVSAGPTTAVPEPTSLALFGLATLTAAYLGCRRRRQLAAA